MLANLAIWVIVVNMAKFCQIAKLMFNKQNNYN